MSYSSSEIVFYTPSHIRDKNKMSKSEDIFVCYGLDWYLCGYFVNGQKARSYWDHIYQARGLIFGLVRYHKCN